MTQGDETYQAIPDRALLIRAKDAAREYGISYPTLRVYWTTGAKGFRLHSWREGGLYILLLRAEVEELARRLNTIEPNVP